MSSSGTGSTWSEHPLIGKASSFLSYRGVGAARLGGYEGSSDRLRQRVLIPPGGILRYWWQISQPRPMSRLTVSLVKLDESDVVVLLVHGDEDSEEGWLQDCIDLSLFSDKEYTLEFHVFNDNYTMTAFGIDEVILETGQGSR